ncbi:MAG: hypothetical protein HOD92_11215 [Deltaproteobacteria bacterium]|jgi:hypothetical protein|nr:hypothetical protein [Deltaproteobacteria bacterium]MBT4525895.1 hypothetical protein [Deltaproteobacteria bacterium]
MTSPSDNPLLATQFDFLNLIEDSKSKEESRLEQIKTKADDLSRQVRNLLLLYPLIRLEYEKVRLGPDGLNMFRGLDTLYLSFAMFDYISECMLFDLGAKRERIIQHLAKEVKRIKPRLSKKNSAQAGEIILDQLCNAKQNHQSFAFDYFDAQKESKMSRSFRLILFKIGEDDEGRYHLTKEGFAAYLSMLELDSNMAQEVDEYLIQKLIDRGNFADALRVAGRNRKRTIELKDSLKQKIFKLNRDIFNVDWQQDIKPFLDQSRDHIQARIKEEGHMLENLTDEIDQTEVNNKDNLLKLHDTIHDCQSQHRDLHKDIMGFNEKFLAAQSRTFRTPRISNLANLEDEILSLLGKKNVNDLSLQAPEITATMNMPSIKRIFDPLMILSVIDDQDREERGKSEVKASDLVLLNNPLDRFETKIIQEMEAYLQQTVPTEGETNLKAVILQAESENRFSAEQILCLVYLSFQWYGNADRSPKFQFEKLTNKKQKLTPKLSKSVYLSGDNLLIKRGE